MDMVKMGANVLGGGSKDGSDTMMNVLKMGKSFSDMMNAKGKQIIRSNPQDFVKMLILLPFHTMAPKHQ